MEPVRSTASRMAMNREPNPNPFGDCIQTLIRGRRLGTPGWGPGRGRVVVFTSLAQRKGHEPGSGFEPWPGPEGEPQFGHDAEGHIRRWARGTALSATANDTGSTLASPR